MTKSEDLWHGSVMKVNASKRPSEMVAYHAREGYIQGMCFLLVEVGNAEHAQNLKPVRAKKFAGVLRENGKQALATSRHVTGARAAFWYAMARVYLLAARQLRSGQIKAILEQSEE